MTHTEGRRDRRAPPPPPPHPRAPRHPRCPSRTMFVCKWQRAPPERARSPMRTRRGWAL